MVFLFNQGNFVKNETFPKLNLLFLKNIEAVLDKETIQTAINVANLNAEKSNKCKFINAAFLAIFKRSWTGTYQLRPVQYRYREVQALKY